MRETERSGVTWQSRVYGINSGLIRFARKDVDRILLCFQQSTPDPFLCVFIYSISIDEADAATFEILKDPTTGEDSEYAKDNTRIFWLGVEIKQADYDTFEVTSYSTAKDKSNLYADDYPI